MRPSQVLDVQAELIDRTRDSRYRRYIAEFFKDQYRKEHGGWAQTMYRHAMRNEEQINEIAYMFSQKMHDALRVCEAYWVSGEMMKLVNFANESIDDFARFENDLPPSEYGFVYLNEPLEFQEIHNRQMKLRVLVWAPIIVRPEGTDRDIKSTLFLGFADAHDQDDITREMAAGRYRDRQDEVRAALAEHHLDDEGLRLVTDILGRYQLSTMDVWAPQQRVGPMLHHVNDKQLARIKDEAAIVYPWSFNLLRWMVTYWTMMQQTVVISAQEPLERKTARRVRRYKLPEQVTVVQLRRRESDREYVGESSVEWQHRWMVRGHWRNQPCGEGRHDVKRIWIHPFVKGPADKPLIQTQKVYALTR